MFQEVSGGTTSSGEYDDSAIKRRLLAVEDENTAQTNDINTLKSDLANNINNDDALSLRVAELENNIADLNLSATPADYEDLKNQVAQNKTDIEALKANGGDWQEERVAEIESVLTQVTELANDNFNSLTIDHSFIQINSSKGCRLLDIKSLT